MKKMILALPAVIAIVAFMSLAARTGHAEEEARKGGLSANKKVLIVYFSHTGNTREIASQIHERVGGDILEIQAVKPYPSDYDTVVKQAREELDAGYKPVLKPIGEDIGSYDVIFVGYPNWWGTFPAPVKTFLSSYHFSGKALAPFCTHEGSAMGNSVEDIQKLCPDARLLRGLAIRGRTVKTAQEKVSEWLREIQIVKGTTS